MTLRIAPLLAALFMALMATAAPARPPEAAAAWNGAEIDWRDLKSGIREAAETGRQVVMVFHAPWCMSCRKYREVFRDKGIVEAARGLIMILVDADADKYANGAFAPDGTYVPRTIFMTPDGNIRTDLTGKTDPGHPHTIDIGGPGELLALMRRAQGLESSPPPSTRAGR